jgi:hypothetical protein
MIVIWFGTKKSQFFVFRQKRVILLGVISFAFAIFSIIVSYMADNDSKNIEDSDLKR